MEDGTGGEFLGETAKTQSTNDPLCSKTDDFNDGGVFEPGAVQEWNIRSSRLRLQVASQ